MAGGGALCAAAGGGARLAGTGACDIVFCFVSVYIEKKCDENEEKEGVGTTKSHSYGNSIGNE